MSKNLDLWNKVCTTDVKYTKPAKKGAYQFTSITPMYQKYLATKALGPQGVFWGVEPESESFVYKEVGTTILLIYRAVMFYKLDGETGRIPIAATEKLAYQTQGANGYLKIDDEADKKVRTAALTKGLSEIGVTADIHMGLHENYEYQEYASAKLRSESGSDQELINLKEEFKVWFKKEKETLALLPNENAVGLVCNRIEIAMMDKLTIAKADHETKNGYKQKLYAAADAAILKLKEKANG